MNPYPQQPYGQMPPPPPQKNNTMKWVLLGCGGLLGLGIVILIVVGAFLYIKGKEFADKPTEATAKLIEMTNKDVEVMSFDEKNKTITLRDKKTGRVTTMTIDQAKNQGGGGSSGSGGSADTSKLPKWIAVYPGSNPTSTFTSTSDNTTSGSFQFKTDDPQDKIFDFYRDKMKADGFSVSENTNKSPVGEVRAVSGSNLDDGRFYNVAVMTILGNTQVTVTYSETKKAANGDE